MKDDPAKTQGFANRRVDVQRIIVAGRRLLKSIYKAHSNWVRIRSGDTLKLVPLMWALAQRNLPREKAASATQ